jgi:DNA mismatch repair ATPase MutS
MTLALFDELFRGTNSEERLAISHAIIDYIREHGALLLAATHDATLTRLAAQGGGMANFHFRERVEGSTMVFDYRLRPGPAPTRNAVRVLEVHGYPAEVTRAARRELGD